MWLTRIYFWFVHFPIFVTRKTNLGLLPFQKAIYKRLSNPPNHKVAVRVMCYLELRKDNSVQYNNKQISHSLWCKYETVIFGRCLLLFSKITTCPKNSQFDNNYSRSKGSTNSVWFSSVIITSKQAQAKSSNTIFNW